MGNCCGTQEQTIKKKFAIKFPNGHHYIYYDEKTKEFIKGPTIDTWIQNLYCVGNHNNWVVYNDDTHKLGNKHTSHGHCKGIVSWSSDTISWLCHSVPNFPRNFRGTSISLIEPGEIIYGQSFQYFEIPYSEKMLYDILHQLNIMDANIYNNNYTNDFIKYKDIEFPKIIKINVLKISEDIVHIAKPYNIHIDIYSDYIARNSSCKWNVESWIRGHHINNKNDMIVDISTLQYDTIRYTSHQDHSKWAVSNMNYYWVGDLNRMTSQYNRGGGGFICNDNDIAKVLNNIIID